MKTHYFDPAWANQDRYETSCGRSRSLVKHHSALLIRVDCTTCLKRVRESSVRAMHYHEAEAVKSEHRWHQVLARLQSLSPPKSSSS